MNWLRKVFLFYYEGFKNMTWGKTVWFLIFLKLFLIFFIMKLFFFSDGLEQRLKTDEEKSMEVLENLTR